MSKKDPRHAGQPDGGARTPKGGQGAKAPGGPGAQRPPPGSALGAAGTAFQPAAVGDGRPSGPEGDGRLGIYAKSITPPFAADSAATRRLRRRRNPSSKVVENADFWGVLGLFALP